MLFTQFHTASIAKKYAELLLECCQDGNWVGRFFPLLFPKFPPSLLFVLGLQRQAGWKGWQVVMVGVVVVFAVIYKCYVSVFHDSRH